ncbi:MAG: hypothetical protein Q8K99_01765 [Actinomycetota bacterium]|nr:hypothetical protein [Actinomycetota bacterium]
MRNRPSIAALVLVGLLAGVALSTTACRSDSRQTTVLEQTPSTEDTSTITPIERGEIRRDALRATQAGIDVWLRDDIDGMREYFADDQYDYFKKQDDSYRTDGKKRVRAHEDASMDVMEMTPDGREVSIKYRFIDRSYFQAADGSRLSEPTGKDTEMTIGAVEFEGKWLLVRIIAGSDVLQ